MKTNFRFTRIDVKTFKKAAHEIRKIPLNFYAFAVNAADAIGGSSTESPFRSTQSDILWAKLEISLHNSNTITETTHRRSQKNKRKSVAVSCLQTKSILKMMLFVCRCISKMYVTYLKENTSFPNESCLWCGEE